MADPSTSHPPEASAALDRAVHSLTAVLLGVASGNYAVRAERTLSGDPLDVLAFLVNSTSEEVSVLVGELEEERKRLREARDQLVLAARLAALGELAAGVAHELNQPLTAMKMLTEFLAVQDGASGRMLEPELSMMGDAIRRMARIVDGVRTFGRPGASNLSATQALRPLKEALSVFRDTFLDLGIQLETRFAEYLPGLLADADQLHQVLVNLLGNAKDALAARPREERRVLVEVYVAGGRVRYVVQDSGHGVQAADADRVFDPFFTTKEVGQGMGLGLAVSHGIAQHHGGLLRYEAAPGGGARFIVELPFTEESGQS